MRNTDSFESSTDSRYANPSVYASPGHVSSRVPYRMPEPRGSRWADPASKMRVPGRDTYGSEFIRMTRFFVRIACVPALLLSSSPLQSQEAPKPAPRANAWTISQPYPNNPLRQATVVGSVSAAGASREAELQIECRAPELARINLLFRPTSLQFDLDPFEGPPGMGQKRKLLQMQPDADPPVSYFFSGFYIESDVFVLAIAPPRERTSEIVSVASAGKPIRIQVWPADDKGDPLVFIFTLPATSAPAQDVAKPCLVLKTKAPQPPSK